MRNSKTVFIVILNALCGPQPVFRNGYGVLETFETKDKANEAISEDLEDIREAVEMGEMSDEYDDDDYGVAEGQLDGTQLTYEYKGKKYQMDLSDEDAVEL